MYVSFVDKPSSCCLEMCELVHEFCQKHGFTNFELYMRLSSVKNENSKRWDKTFLIDQLDK